MKLKKFQANTEELALSQINSELGNNALILSVKKIKQNGIRSLFSKEKVEVTVAFDEEKLNDKLSTKDNFDLSTYEKEFKLDVPEQLIAKEKGELTGAKEQFTKEKLLLKAVNENTEDKDYFNVSNEIFKTTKENEFTKENETNYTKDENFLDIIEPVSKTGFFSTENNEKSKDEKIVSLQSKLKKTEEEVVKLKHELFEVKTSAKNIPKIYKNPKLNIFYKALKEQKVLPEIITFLLGDLARLKNNEDAELDFLVRILYNKIIKILDNDNNNNEPVKDNKTIMFIGPTGVGKTTTIAKLSSHYILTDSKSVGLLTSDTYRIAAIEQLKTYAEILNIDIKVVYDSMELVDNLVFMSRKNEIVLIDTAGRSHKNDQSLDDLKDLLEYVQDSKKYLVLSITTKYDDIIKIINTYSALTDFEIIFTKLDETDCFGTLLNVCYKTGKRIAYLTNGQNVPDDIMQMNPCKIAKLLLGIGGI